MTALAAGSSELTWGSAERWLLRLHRYAPRLVATLLRNQRRRFAYLMTPEPPGRDRHG